MTHYFPDNYEKSRAIFRNHLVRIKEKWPNAKVSSRLIGEERDNTIDWIYAEATETNENIVFLSSGEHGIEGYAGAAAIHLFVEEYLDRIDAKKTGICLIHALNPWGMRNFRRVTENNIDLNRNYVYNQAAVPEDVNRKYEKEEDLFLPSGKLKDLSKEKTKLYAELTKGLVKEGYSGIKEAKSMGQFEFEKGVYYGGKAAEESAGFLKQIQNDLLGTFKRVVHMDWHTALGPSNELTMVLSQRHTSNPEKAEETYNIQNVVLYSDNHIKGDSNNHFYLMKDNYPDTYLFSALFEFGTFGDGKKAELRELMTIVFENQLYWNGAKKEEDRQFILDEFKAMFYPEDKTWRNAVIKEAKHGIESVLLAENIISDRPPSVN